MINRMVKCNAVMITSYQGVRLYRDSLLRYKWDYIILDEGHKIRNPDADITLTCKQVSSVLNGKNLTPEKGQLCFNRKLPSRLGIMLCKA